MNKVNRMELSLALTLGVLLCFAGIAHCATGTTRRNSLGVVIGADNPNVYLLATIADGTRLGDGHKEATNIRFSPAYTPMLYSETVMFCGNQAERFNDLPGLVIVTYRRAASSLYRGVACHELIGVTPVYTPNNAHLTP